MAARSMAKPPRITGWRRAKLRPRRIAATGRSCSMRRAALGWEKRHRGERRAERDDVDRIRRRQTEMRDHQAADGGARDQCRLEQHDVEGQRSGQAVDPHEVWNDRRASGRIDRPDQRRQRDHGVDGEQWWVTAERPQGEERGA